MDDDIFVDISQYLEIAFVLESQLDGLDLFVGTMGEVSECAVFDFPVLAIGLAEQVSGVFLAVGLGSAGVDMHSGHMITTLSTQYKYII